MSKRDHEIARQSATLTQRRLRLHQQQQALHQGVTALCKKPSTLACATLTGFVLARICPMVYGVKLQPSADGTGTSGTSGIMTTLRVVLISLAPTLLKQAITAGISSLNTPREQRI